MFEYSRPDSIPNSENKNISKGSSNLYNIQGFKTKHEVSLCPCYNGNPAAQDLSCMIYATIALDYGIS